MLTKLCIEAFDETFGRSLGEFKVQINPNQLKWTKGINYSSDKTLQRQRKADAYTNHQREQMSFDFVLDDTGIASDCKESIPKRVQDLENLVYTINPDAHRPNYVKISWGDFIFKGQISGLSYDYTLFSPQGAPLRVRISVVFIAYQKPIQSAKDADLNSPDMSRLIRLKAGETLAAWCDEIYGNASYCADVAMYNGMSGFRNIEAGSSVMFPPLLSKYE